MVFYRTILNNYEKIFYNNIILFSAISIVVLLLKTLLSHFISNAINLWHYIYLVTYQKRKKNSGNMVFCI